MCPRPAVSRVVNHTITLSHTHLTEFARDTVIVSVAHALTSNRRPRIHARGRKRYCPAINRV